MRLFLIGLASGIYGTGAVGTFLYVGFFVILGGSGSDLWRPFAYALAWPVMLPMFLAGKAG